MPEITARLSTALADRYKIERHLGEGGMATVYLAHDLKHDRKVALKVLKPELAAILGAERFLSEIKVTANLQHPNILPLYDSGEADSFLYYVMPFVEGDTLRDKLNREKQLSVEETVEIVKSVSAALQYAHEREIVHRDIKPENILLQSGQALVADFGIALAVSQAGGARLTETGLSLGTPHYMSPEQAAGDRVLDARSDVYSLGAMVYEMLTGEPPYTGGTVQAIIAKILTEDPRPLRALRPSVPEHVDAALITALARLPADRMATAARFAEALDRPGTVAARVVRSPAPARNAWMIGVVATLGIVAAWGWLARPSPPAGQTARFLLAFPAGQDLHTDPFSATWSAVGGAAVSPDGSRLVYVGPGEDGVTQLWLRPIGQLEARPIPGTTGGGHQFFSPDGQSIGFFTQEPAELKVASLTAGPPITLAPAEAGFGGDWGDDGQVYFSGHPDGVTHQDALFRIAAGGGIRELIARPDTGPANPSYRWIDVLPNAKGALLTVWQRDSLTVAAVDFATGQVKYLVPGFYARYVKGGYVIFARAGGELLAAPFDQDEMRLTGDPRVLIDGVLVDAVEGGAQFAVSDNGTLFYLAGSEPPKQIVELDRDGTVTPLDTSYQRDFRSLALSPDGTKLAVSIASADGEQIWIHDLVTGTRSRLSLSGSYNARAAWHPEGRHITFVSTRDGERALYSRVADGSAPAERLLSSGRPVQEAEWSSDGRLLVYREGPGGATGRDISYAEITADTVRHSFLATEYDELNPKLSPNGRWLAYVSDESGRSEVYVRSFPGPGGRWQVSTDGGAEPLWAHSGRELFFRSENSVLVAIEVGNGPDFTVGSRRALFSVNRYQAGPNHTGYDLTPDDRRFLFVQRAAPTVDMVVVLNWFEELKAKVGN